jgi:hypothetical protein
MAASLPLTRKPTRPRARFAFHGAAIGTPIWPNVGDGSILSKKDFRGLRKKDLFKIGLGCATLIQEFDLPDSIVANFYFTAFLRRLFRQYRSTAVRLRTSKSLPVFPLNSGHCADMREWQKSVSRGHRPRSFDHFVGHPRLSRRTTPANKIKPVHRHFQTGNLLRQCSAMSMPRQNQTRSKLRMCSSSLINPPHRPGLPMRRSCRPIESNFAEPLLPSR